MRDGTKRHEEILDSLQERLLSSSLDYTIFCHIGYSMGELDLVAMHGCSLLVFEIKSSSRLRAIKKTSCQLDRAFKYAKEYTKNLNPRKMYFFEVYGKKDGSYTIRRYHPTETP